MPNHTPADGDLTIARRADDGTFEISVHPGRPQLRARFKNEAITRAFAYAAGNEASVWFIEKNGEFVRIDHPPVRES